MLEYLSNCTASTFNELWKYWTVRLCFGNWFKHIVDLGWDILHSAIASCRISQPSSTIWFHQLPKHSSPVQYILLSTNGLSHISAPSSQLTLHGAPQGEATKETVSTDHVASPTNHLHLANISVIKQSTCVSKECPSDLSSCRMERVELSRHYASLSKL